MRFVSFFFLNKKKNPNLTFDDTLQNAVHYANLNSSSINEPYLRTVEYAISVFLFSYQWLLSRGFCQKLYEKATIFNANF